MFKNYFKSFPATKYPVSTYVVIQNCDLFLIVTVLPIHIQNACWILRLYQLEMRLNLALHPYPSKRLKLCV